MRAAIYNPYLDTLGGGELYTMSVARLLLERGYVVDVQWRDVDIKKRIEDRFNLKLKEIKIVNNINRGDGYDLCFWLSDGSIPILRSRNNILHFQFPFKNVGGRTLINKMKLARIRHIVCNSNFTKSHIDKEYSVNSTVIYPPVNTSKFKPSKKENVIFYLGRFSNLAQQKRQDILVEVFKKFSRKNPGWRLVLAGGAEVGAKEFLEKLKKRSVGFNIEILESPDFREVKRLYGVSKFFWSAAGYGVDLESHPEKVEHFGISVVEAMASGCVPVVFSAGGYKEIIEDSINGYLWSKKKELLTKTQNFLYDPKLWRKMSIAGRKDSGKYSYEEFAKNFKSLL
ncbi:MAG: Glycosyl transferase [Candidatus Woesebacteria bacterium GW2011_GWB1_43_14]|uniref:Glycosyl transferase n=1 Tax=Candidatus Woesebacteria bacterium GW2011_GWB1_43_14 TaxID=1618578 RepID=A0A0G1DHC1_9BACT|nr:MAG: Glycosyl transferase [Candidatus Woesebacteria bacterium GW2011_GWA1_39_11b]KKS78322.1 MAG: Glycosyl transferase [Candidatus Woesebacteria bacterium GW2011_GWC1_42_9]KKS97260.1 MAG: Glycosyl transferase [Candidatus Woesebacteria bacterium GW2011_GWB1_43_14]